MKKTAKKIEKSVTGCQVFYGGEIKHHKDCVFYPESLSEKYDKLERENTKVNINDISNEITKENLLKIGFEVGKHDHILQKLPIEVNIENHNIVTIYGHVVPCENINDIDRLYFALTKKKIIDYNAKEIAKEIYDAFMFTILSNDAESAANEASKICINKILQTENSQLYLDVKKEINAIINWTNFDFLKFRIKSAKESIDTIKSFKDSIYFCGCFIEKIAKYDISRIKQVSYFIDLINFANDKEKINSDLQSFKIGFKELVVKILKESEKEEKK